MPSQNLRIGITIGLNSPGESLWTNGIKQNAVYLAEALRHVPAVGSVLLVNTTDVRLTDAPWDLARWPTVAFSDVKDSLDILIELGGAVGDERTSYLKQRGTRLVSYCCGVEYVMAMQSMLFNRPLWGANLHINQRYDGVWVIPQVAPSSQHFFQTLRRRPVEVVPFVWDPVFLRERSAALAHGGEYRPRPGPRRISVMEPNVDVVKFCLYPLVHNSEFIKGCGYYYPHFDCQAGGAALLRAFMEHDRRLDDEKRSTAALLHSVDVANPDNIQAYTRELLALFKPR